MVLYAKEGKRLTKIPFTQDISLSTPPVWIDLLDMTQEEEVYVEALLGIDIPSREEMREIEVSSRLYHQDSIAFMTASVVSKADTPEPEIHPVTFILSGNTLVTLRYSNPQPFLNFTAMAETLPESEQTSAIIFARLTDAIIERIADILERVGKNVDVMAKQIFRAKSRPADEKLNYQDLLEKIGFEGDLMSKTRESLMTLNRMVSYAMQAYPVKPQEEAVTRLSIVTKDIAALSDHVTFLSSKVNFLLDATLGMINIEQNSIIKIFSVAAAVFLPPTLIASIYGMNFNFMPELEWQLGYPLAIGLMALSSWLPYTYFKRKKWL